MMHRLDRILSRIEGTVILVCYTTLIALVGLETVRRMLTGGQAIWGPEIALFAFIWLSWFAMAEHLRHGTHLSFGLLRHAMPPRIQKALELFDCALWILIGAIIITGSTKVVMTNISMGQTVFGTSIPLAAASLAVPLGWAFTMIRVVQRAYIVATPDNKAAVKSAPPMASHAPEG